MFDRLLWYLEPSYVAARALNFSSPRSYFKTQSFIFGYSGNSSGARVGKGNICSELKDD